MDEIKAEFFAARVEFATQVEQEFRSYRAGDVVCMRCRIVIRNDPRITSGVSHGYCEPCGKIELAKIEIRIAKKEDELKTAEEWKEKLSQGEL